MNPSWRYSFTYSNNDLNENIQRIQSGEFFGDYGFRREILLQAHERGLIEISDEFHSIPSGDWHTIPASAITLIPQQNLQRSH